MIELGSINGVFLNFRQLNVLLSTLNRFFFHILLKHLTVKIILFLSLKFWLFLLRGLVTVSEIV